MRARWLIVFVIAGALCISWFGIERVMTPTQVRLLEKTQTVSGLDIYYSGSTLYYENKDAIKSLTFLMRNKVARVDRSKNYESYRDQAAVLSFDYGYKGRPYLIDGEGRIVVAYRKYEFARDSWFIPYRLIWNSNNEILCYITEPDKRIKALVDEMKREMRI